MKKGKLNIVYGGQAGSESKGKQAAFLADKFDIHYFAGCLSPNAGHTVIGDNKKVVTHHIPVGVVGSRDITKSGVFIGPAAIINPAVLLDELGTLQGLGLRKLVIDARATIIQPHHIKSEEKTMMKIGSTTQGVGEARADRIMRRGLRAGDSATLNERGLVVPNVGHLIRELLDYGETVLYEMGQGFDLGIDHGISPIYCTSRNCTPMQALADMGIPPKYLGDVYAVIRSYPIRVNNRTGSSGPYPSKEITWEEIRRRCKAPHDLTEMTTTTKLVRRVFEFSMDRIREMVEVCDPTYLCLQFVNYLDWGIYGENKFLAELPPRINNFIQRLETETNKPTAYLGTSGDHKGMIDLGVDE